MRYFVQVQGGRQIGAAGIVSYVEESNLAANTEIAQKSHMWRTLLKGNGCLTYTRQQHPTS
jgi:hypothetical protein